MEGTALGLSNTDEMVWYRLAPEDATLQVLSSIFDLKDKLAQEDSEDLMTYAALTENGEIFFHRETEQYVAYFIFNRQHAHVLLRKTFEWEQFNTQMEELFRFVEPKNEGT